MNKTNVLKKLFFSTLYLSAFTFGGGYVIISLMKNKFVDDYKWISEEEMLDLVAIAQSAPGPIAVNGAIVIGYKVAGVLGMLVAILATIIPPFTIICVISLFYKIFQTNIYIKTILEGMQSGVGAVIASVVYDMAYPIVKSKNIVNNIIMVGAFLITYCFDINVVYVILFCGLFGVVRTLIEGKRIK